MRIAFFVGDISRSGGTERMTQLLSNEFSKTFEVSIISVNDHKKKPTFELNKSINCISLVSEKYKKIITPLIIIFRLAKYLKNTNTDILISVDSALALYSLPTRLINNHTKYFFWEHFSVFSDSGNINMERYRKYALKYGDAYITLTNEDAIELQARYKSNCLITSIPNICPFSIFEEKYNDLAKEILTVGHLSNIKGQDLALLVSKKVFEKHLDWKWKFFGDGKDRNKLELQAKNLAIEENVEFVGKELNLSEAYTNASIYVSTSRSEGFGLSLVEAQAFNLPTIAFDVPFGPRQIIANNINGYLIEPYNIEDMADKICNLIEDNELRCSFSEHATDNLKQFSKESVVAKWKELIFQTMKQFH